MTRRYLALTGLLVALMLGGCGFHLRGTVDIPPGMKNIRVNSVDPELGTRIEDLLRQSGALPQKGEKSPSTVLRVTSARFDRNVSTVDTRGKVTGYALVYTVNYSARRGDGTALLEGETLNLQRDYEFKSAEMLAKESEENFLRQDMVRDAAQQIVRQLARALR